MKNHVNWNLLAAYIAGELEGPKVKEIESWINKNKDNLRLYQELKHLYDFPEKSGAPGSFDKDDSFSKLTGRIRPGFEADMVGESARASKSVGFPGSHLLLRVAAVVILGLIGYAALDMLREEIQDESALVVKETPRGQKSKIQLPDGTIAWLNAESKLQYPEIFDDSVRKIYLEGEAFFDVKHDKSRPFVIDMNGGRIKVLGTSFNVRVYPGEQGIETTVLTGKVAFQSEDDASSYILPGEQVIYHKLDKVLIKQPIDTGKIVAWTRGELIFRDESLKDVARELERWFDIKMNVRNKKLLKCRITANFNNKSLEEILKNITEILPIDYELKDNQVALTGKGCD